MQGIQHISDHLLEWENDDRTHRVGVTEYDILSAIDICI
jgi:hypothetical protein